MFSKAIAITALAASASAHMIITNPVPFGKDTLNNSPLGPSDFPCKQRNGVYAISTMNQWNAGETQDISFQGTATHGGGSCQFSITTDAEPTEKSQWKVIQSVVGGCPTDAKGNLDGPDAGKKPATFPVTMPKNIPDGRYTFAWTWINKVGNREFYMNCAPIQVGSAAGTASTASTASAAKVLSALPDMFVANLPADSCSTAENQDFQYPNPGQTLVTGKLASPGSTLTGAGCTKMTAMGAGAGTIGSPAAGSPSTPSQGTTPAQSSAAAPSAAAPSASVPSASAPAKGPSASKAPSNPGGVFAPGAASSPAAAQPTVPAAQPTVPAAQPAPVASAAPQAPANSTPSNGDCTPCTNDGAVVCMSKTQFGLCNRGCAVAQDLAAGMMCSNGAVVAMAKRSFQFPRAHLHRRHSGRVL